MRRLRQHWRIMAAVCLVLAVGGSLWWRSVPFGTALAEDPPGYDPISEYQRDAVMTLLGDVGLDRDALIALNPSSSQAESVLSTIRTWQENNQTTLANLKTTRDRKVTALRQIEKAIRTGPADPSHESQLALARQDLATAKAAYRSALGSLENSVLSLLSDSQKATWTAIKSGHGQTMPIRMLALSDAQRLAVSKAYRDYRRKRAAAATAEQRQAAQTTWESALDQILTTDQKNVVAAYYSNYATASGAAANAFDTVLAVEGG